MNDFIFYFQLGWDHIISLDALDHLLFITVLSALYLFHNWKPLLILVTAFTIGHSLTLALSVYNIVKINSSWVEFLIPVTIVITAMFNLVSKKHDKASYTFNYLMALFFGLIHGLGFANTIRFMLSKDQHIAVPLLSFNIGLEVGQICVVVLIILLSYFIVNKAGLKRNWWISVLSVFSLIWAMKISIQRWPL